MKRVLIILIICFSFLITVQAQTDNPLKKGMVNTVELSNGDVIYDLNGEWEVSVEHYGPWAQFGVVSDISAIKQDGASFVGVTLLGSPRSPKGSEKLKGELEKLGFITQEDVSKLGVEGDKVAVYFPHSYNFSGELFIVQARPETVHSQKDNNKLLTCELKQKSDVVITGTERSL